MRWLEHHLEDVAGADVLLARVSTAAMKPLARRRTTSARAAPRRAAGSAHGSGAAQARDLGLEPRDRGARRRRRDRSPPRACVTTLSVCVRLSNTLTTSPNMNTASGSSEVVAWLRAAGARTSAPRRSRSSRPRRRRSAAARAAPPPGARAAGRPAPRPDGRVPGVTLPPSRISQRSPRATNTSDGRLPSSE